MYQVQVLQRLQQNVRLELNALLQTVEGLT